MSDQPITKRHEQTSGATAADQALQRLLEGNQRFQAGQPAHPNQTRDRRHEVMDEQRPFAAILACTDSAAPPELIFDQGIGDLFVVRVAGNLANDSAVVGSLEFVAQTGQVPLIVVLGHSQCHAAATTVETMVSGKPPTGSYGSIVAAIWPAAEHVRNQPGDRVANTGRANVELVVWQLQHTPPLLASRVEAGQLKIVGAWYDGTTGRVDVIV